LRFLLEFWYRYFLLLLLLLDLFDPLDVQVGLVVGFGSERTFTQYVHYLLQVQGLLLQQSLGEIIYILMMILDQLVDLLRALIDDALNFVINELVSGVGVGFLELSVLVPNIPDSLAHTELGDDCMRQLVGLLEVIVGSSRDPTKEVLLGAPTAQDAAYPIQQLLVGLQLTLIGEVLGVPQ